MHGSEPKTGPSSSDLNWDEIRAEVLSGDYENAVKTMQKHFGHVAEFNDTNAASQEMNKLIKLKRVKLRGVAAVAAYCGVSAVVTPPYPPK